MGKICKFEVSFELNFMHEKKGSNFKLNDKSIKVFAGNKVCAQIHRPKLIPSQWCKVWKGLQFFGLSFLKLFKIRK